MTFKNNLFAELKDKKYTENLQVLRRLLLAYENQPKPSVFGNTSQS